MSQLSNTYVWPCPWHTETSPVFCCQCVAEIKFKMSVMKNMCCQRARAGFTRFCFHFSFTYPNVSVLLSLERERVFLFFKTRCLTSSAQFVTGSTYLSVNVKKKKKVKP